MAKKNVIGYNVYRAADGCGEEFYGFASTLEEAKSLAKKGRSLEESMYATAEAAGHCGGLYAPDKTHEGEVAEWFGEGGYDCAVEVLGNDQYRYEPGHLYQLNNGSYVHCYACHPNKTMEEAIDEFEAV